MPKDKEVNINEMLLKAHKLAVKNAIETSIRTKTSLIVYKDGKVKSVKPPFKYVLVPIKTSKKQPTRSRALKKKT
jgi:hypothetical protein